MKLATKGKFALTKTSKHNNLAKMGTSVLVNRNAEEENRVVELFQAKEEEIEKKKMQVREKLKFRLDRAEDKTRQLAQVWDVSALIVKP